MSHSRNPGYIAGDHWVECMRCGLEYRQSYMKTEWNGSIVCSECWEPRHPQDFVRAKEEDQSAQGIVNPASASDYQDVSLLGLTGYFKYAKYEGVNHAFTSEVTATRGMYISPNGKRVYILDDTTDSIYQYDLATKDIISSASYTGNSFSIAAQSTNPRGITFKPDGTEMFISTLGGGMYHYTLSTPWDITTSVYTSLAVGLSNCGSIQISSDGGNFYLTNAVSDTVVEYIMPNEWSFSAAETPTGDILNTGGANSYAILLRGQHLYVGDNTLDTIYHYVLDVDKDLSTAQRQKYTLDYALVGIGVVYGFSINAEGTYAYMLNNTGTVYQVTLNTTPEVPVGTFTL